MSVQKSCRLCLSSECDTISVFSNTPGKSWLLISDMVKTICPISIEIDDRMSRVICSKCLSVITAAYELRLTSIRNEEFNRARPAAMTYRDGNSTTRKRARKNSIELDDSCFSESSLAIDFEEPTAASSTHRWSDGNMSMLNQSTLSIRNEQPNDQDISYAGEHVCEHCNKEFFSSVGIRKHYTLHHPDKKFVLSHPCPHENCKEKFSSAKSLSKHRITHKGNNTPKPKIIIESEKKRQSPRLSGQKKEAISAYFCGICQRNCLSEQDLNLHISRKHGRISII